MAEEVSPRERLIEAAALLFHRDGYNAVGVNELCKAADVRKGSFYHFFDSKEALARAAVDRNRRKTALQVLEPSFKSDVPPVDRILRYFDTLAEINGQSIEDFGCVLGCPFGNLAAEIGGEGLIAEAVDEAFSDIRSYFEQCLRDAKADGADVDPIIGAEQLLAYMEGVILVARSRKDADHVRRLGKRAPAVVGL